MFLPDCLTREVDNFSGPWLTPEATDVPLPKGLLARNVQYNPGNVSTRLGHAAIFADTAATGGFTTLMNWLFNHAGSGLQNFLVGYAPGVGVRAINLLGGNTVQTVAGANAAAAGVCAVNAGQRCFLTLYNSASQGVPGTVAAVIDYQTAITGNPTLYSDPLFAAPVSSVPTITESGTGVTTAGLHRFGFLLTTRYGFTTQWSPVNGSTKFVPVEFTSAGGTNITFSVSGPGGGIWPAYCASLQVIMTTAANPNEYYAVPGATATIPGGSAGTVTVTFSVNDGDLPLGGAVTKYESLLTLDISNIPPFIPSFMFVYANRMAYVTVDKAGFPVVYFSEPDNYQTVTADQHGVYMPGNMQVITGQPIHGVCYLFGPHWTYAVSDNGQAPTQWARPQLVDGAIGTLSPYGVCINASQNFAWVADTAGLYLFQGGVFPAKPVSYYQTTDWKRINWNAATAVKVIDDKDNKKVCVMAPLDGTTSPSHILTWDYTQGTDAENMAYSLDNLANYPLGAVEMVENPTNRNVERWFAPTGIQSVIRPRLSTDATPYRDINTAIDSVYWTALFPGQDGQRGGLHQFHAVMTRGKGAGNLAVTPYSLDGVEMAPTFQIALSNAPGKIFRNRFYLINEALSLYLAMTGQLDGFFQISSLTVAYTMWSPLR